MFDSQIQFNSIVPCYGPGVLFFTGSNEDAVVIGNENENTRLDFSAEFHLSVRRATENSSDQHTGIKLINIYSSKLFLSSFNFYRGIKLYSNNGKGVAYNQIYLNMVYNAVEGLELHAGPLSG
jgi:hypothetical protein